MSDPSSVDGASGDETGGNGVFSVGIWSRLKDWVIRRLSATPSFSHKEVKHRLDSLTEGDYVTIQLHQKFGGQRFEGRVLSITKACVRGDAVHLDDLMTYDGSKSRSFSVLLREIHSIKVIRELRR